MKAENRNSILVWAIVVLAVMNISTILTVMYHKFQSDKAVVVTSVDTKQAEADSEKFSGRYFRDQLNLNSDQMEKFKAINPAFRPKARNITLELANQRKEMLAEMAAIQSDTSRLNVLSDSIGRLHSDLKKISYRYYLGIKSICDPEQQRKLEQIFSEMFSNDSPMGSSGKGGQKGWQGGRRFSN
ncbi:MAG: periplasmic heavy metal sensor [Prolixibacteraceae bacterium]